LTVGAAETLGGGDRYCGDTRASGSDHRDQRAVPRCRSVVGTRPSRRRELGPSNRASGTQQGVEKLVRAEVRTNGGVGTQGLPIVRCLRVGDNDDGDAVFAQSSDQVPIDAVD
jgi:hypothetical protein